MQSAVADEVIGSVQAIEADVSRLRRRIAGETMGTLIGNTLRDPSTCWRWNWTPCANMSPVCADPRFADGNWGRCPHRPILFLVGR